MKEKMVLFNEALREAIDIVSKALPAGRIPIIVRDIYGRIRIAFNEEDKALDGFEEKITREWAKLGHYGQYEGKKVLLAALECLNIVDENINMRFVLVGPGFNEITRRWIR